MDEFIDQLLREDRVTDIQLPRLQVNTEQIQFIGYFEKDTCYINSLHLLDMRLSTKIQGRSKYH